MIQYEKTFQDSTSYNKFFKGCVFVQGDEKTSTLSDARKNANVIVQT